MANTRSASRTMDTRLQDESGPAAAAAPPVPTATTSGAMGKTAAAQGRASQLCGPAAIAALNEDVQRITAAAEERAAATGEPLADEFIAVRRPQRFGGVLSGAPIYQPRPRMLTYSMLALAGVLLGLSMLQLAVWQFLAIGAVVFVTHDFFSGMMHVVLDEPANIWLPLVGQGVLESHFHHLIPADIARKDLMDAFGDLSVIIAIMAAIHIPLTTDYLRDPIGMTVGGWKLALAFYGQWVHRSLHSRSPDGPSKAVRLLQSVGLMMPTRRHREHHRNPFDKNFCLLIGFGDPLVYLLRRTLNTIHPYLFVAAFALLSCVDLPLLAAFFRWAWAA